MIFLERKRYFIIGVTALILVVLLAVFTSGDEIKSYELNKTDFKETLSASGRVEAKNRIDMIFQKAGTIQEIFGVEGEFYKKGDPLIILGKVEEENDVDSKNLQLRMAQNNFNDTVNQYKIKSLNYEVSKTSFENIKLMYERSLKLYEAGGVSQKELEDLLLQVKEAEARALMAEIEYQSYAPGGSVREKALIDIQNAKIQLEKAEIERNKKIIYAPFDGQVLTISKEAFSNVQMGEVGLVYSEEKSYITTDIDERDYQKVKAGQKAFIQFLNSSEILEGTVRDVSPVIDRTKGTIKVRIDLDTEVALKTDIGVNVEIIVSEYEDKIILPSEFVFQNPERIIINNNGKALVIPLNEYYRAHGYYVLMDREIENYLGKNVIAVDLEDGKTIK